MIDLSIVPLYRCNMSCSFCYLGSLRSSDEVLELEAVENVLSQHDVRVLDVYGGEVTLLSKQYVDELAAVLKRYFKDETVYMTSNALEMQQSAWMQHVADGFVYPSFSYDTCRPRAEEVKKAIQQFDKLGLPYSVICLDVADLDYGFLASLESMKTFSVKPFSKSKYMSSFTCEPHMAEICKSLAGMPQLYSKLERPNEFRDKIQHCFLLPNGKLHDIQYEDGEELFCPIEDCTAKASPICLCCKYYKCCFNEHYAGYVVPKDADCLGRRRAMELLDEQ